MSSSASVIASNSGGEGGADPALDIAQGALRRLLDRRAELEPVLDQARRLDRAISEQRRVIARLRGAKSSRPGRDSDAGRVLALLEQHPRPVSLESVARTFDWERDHRTSRALSRLVAGGWAERIRQGVYRAA